MHSDAGLWGSAMDISKEVVQIREKVWRSGRTAYLLDMVTSLHGLSYYSDLNGCYEEGAKETEKAIKLWRMLVKRSRDEYLPYLARSLHGLTIDLGRAGRHAIAIKMAQEAIETYRKLVGRSRDTYLFNLANCLYSLETIFCVGMRYEEARSIGDEVIQIRRELIEKNCSTHLNTLLWSLHDMTKHLHMMGREEDAARVAEEVVTLRQEVMESNDLTYLPHTAWALQNLAVGRDGLDAYEEAVELGGARNASVEPVQGDPRPHTFELVFALITLADSLRRCQSEQEAEMIELEVTRMRREVDEGNLGSYIPRIARLVDSLALKLPLSRRSRGKAIQGELGAGTNRDSVGGDCKRSVSTVTQSLENLGTLLLRMRHWFGTAIVNESANETRI
ncbi:hypothetical protein FRC03_008950 [Tulasnella sp. 419]|nr:hypothetical protein FRC03_008950 [Tulasnella sp. 419]